MKELYPDESPGWKAEIFAEVSYEDPYMITLKMDAYTYTGGAHGYGFTRYLNFDKEKGSEMEAWQLFKNQADFERFAEGKFRVQEQIPKDQSINSTGFMFEQDSFHLPENIGFTWEGVTLHYNQYEVASYADGPIEVTIPYNEMQPFLNHEIKS